MKRSRFIIFACAGILALALTACVGRHKVEQSPLVNESATFPPAGQNTAEPVQNETAPVQQNGLLRLGHVQCMPGEGDVFRPNDTVTRGQLAQVLSGLLNNGGTASGGEVSFSDVPTDSPVYASVEQLAALGVLNGYGDGTFRPDEPVTRGEMVAVLCRMTGVGEVTALAFPDVPAEHWAMGSVAAAMTQGWLYGFQDGGFYPDAPLTRAEAVVLLDRARGWTPNKTAIDLACESSPYQDVPKDFWAYYDIVDASYSNELLALVMGEAENVSQGIVLLDGRLGHINGEMKLDYFQKGFHTIQDGLASDGLYYAPEDGYFLQRNQPGLQELDGSMFYVQSADGPFVTNYDLGYLHFGENGRYTSGDQMVDGFVDSILTGIIQGRTSSLLNEDKLREAYNVLLFGDYDYMTRPTGWQRGTTSWALQCARTMYQTKRGSCYYWAASFLYLARRLGFQAYPVCGGVNENNALHAWVMIDHGDELDDNDVNTEESKNELTRVIDEDEYIYDIELDWAYRTGAHGRVPIRPGRDLFKQTRGQTIVKYIFPGDTWEAPPMDDSDALGNGDEEDGENNGGLFDDGTGDDMVEGVDYTTSYVNNGDGTITVTITYLTGDRAGTTTSYTILDPNYTGPGADPTEPPVTEPPVTEPPATDVPVTEVPVTDVPVTEVPVTDVPVTDVPVTDVPVTDVPVTEVPVTEVPVTDVPVTDVPVTDVPVTDVPVTEVPVIDEPVVEDPGTDDPMAPPADQSVPAADQNAGDPAGSEPTGGETIGETGGETVVETGGETAGDSGADAAGGPEDPAPAEAVTEGPAPAGETVSE